MREIHIGSISGTPIKLDLMFLVILPPSAWPIGSDVMNLMAIVNDLLGSTIGGAAISAEPMQWVLGGAAAIGLFADALLHELGHSFVTVRYGYEAKSITLWPFGGVARLKEIPEGQKQELTIAVVGPAVSVVIGVASCADFLLLSESQTPAQFVLSYLVLVNISLAMLNMLLGLPMGGGCVLRALLARDRPHAKATQVTAEVGKVFAFPLGLLGLFFNLFLIAFTFFTHVGASGKAQQTVLRTTFQGMAVRNIMTGRENLDVADEKTSVAGLLERMFVKCHTGYPVLRNGSFVDMITLDDVRGVKGVKRGAFRVDDIMSDELMIITPDADAMDTTVLTQECSVSRLSVVDEAGELVGLVSRSDLTTAFNIIRSCRSFDAMPRFNVGLAQLR